MNPALRRFVTAAVVALTLAPSVAAQPAAETVLEQCAADLGLTAEECACTLEVARPQLTEQQIAYFLVRIARNQAEVERMRTFMPLGERLPILFIIMRAVRECAPGKDVEMPAS